MRTEFVFGHASFVVSFFPPSDLPGGKSTDIGVGLLSVHFLVVAMIPTIVQELHGNRPAWRIEIR